MRFIAKIWLVLIASALVPCALLAASFSASLDRETMTLGESATLSLTFEGGDPSNVTTESVPGLQMKKVGNSTQVSSDFSGHSTAVTTWTIAVTPSQTGDFTIPVINAEINGQKFASKPIALKVTAVTAPSAAAINSGNEVAFLKVSFPKQQVYVGQCAVAALDLYLREDVVKWGDFQMTSAPTDGFSAGQTTDLQQQNRVRVGNRNYNIVHLALPLRVVKEGALVLGPFTATATVILPTGDAGNDPFSQMGVNSPFFRGVRKQVNLASDPIKIESKPLPEQNKPANFSGAVGNFTMSATAGPTTVTVGDPITVRVQIAGQGALDAVNLPTQDAWRDFKTFPPTSKVENGDQFGFQGTKTFEQIISPQNADVHELPAFTFSFFNPDDNQYHTLTQAAVPLVVKAAAATPAPTVAVAKNSTPENQAPQDILPIKEHVGVLTQARVPLLVQPVFLGVQSLPLLAFVAAFVWRQRTDSLANNPRLRRRRAVALLVASGLGDLKKCAAANQPDEFFATLFRLLQEQLGERLDCPASAITENVLEEQALLRNAPATTREALREQFQLCNQARYAPVRGTSELNSVANHFEKLIRELQELKA